MKQESFSWSAVRGEEVEGRGWQDTHAPFDRLPARAEALVPSSVWGLSRHSAGLCYHFATDAPQLAFRWSLTSASLAMPHMPATGVSGIDLYARDRKGRWRFVQCGQPHQRENNQITAAAAPPGEVADRKERAFRLYLPLYNGTAQLEVGVPRGAQPPRRVPSTHKPIVFYGTSITQGGCASRPGMAFTAIAARALDWPHINLGFSGSGKMEPALAALLCELDPAVIVLDCLRNMSDELVQERMEPFLRQLRQRFAAVPILCAGDAFLDNPRETSRGKRTKDAIRRLQADKLGGITFVSLRGGWGDDGEGTVDTVHPNDIGMSRQAALFQRALAPHLSQRD